MGHGDSELEFNEHGHFLENLPLLLCQHLSSVKCKTVAAMDRPLSIPQGYFRAPIHEQWV